MKLIGSYGSPFVRRTAITLQSYGVEYESVQIRYIDNALRAFNPVQRIPAFVLDDGSVLVDSAVIIDHFDHIVGPGRSLTPLSGIERSQMLSLLAIASGGTEKMAAIIYEVDQRPKDKQLAQWIEKLGLQCKMAFEHLDKQFVGPWMMGEKFCQLDIACVAYWDAVAHLASGLAGRISVPNIKQLISKTSNLPAFEATKQPAAWFDRGRAWSAATAEVTDFASLSEKT